jgi:hypothetical protein
MKFIEEIGAKANVRIIARERGKKVPKLCRESHNVWVNIGREYLAKVISPLLGFTGHVNDNVVQYMGLGIGGDQQLLDLTGPAWTTLAAHYPGQNLYDDTTTDRSYLERPVKVTGTPGVGTAPGVWLSQVAAPPTFLGTPITKVDFETLFDYTDINLTGAYPTVPLSEASLVLSSEVASRLSNEVYDYGSAPDYINVSTRQKLVAYNTFDTLAKTEAVSLELHWEIQF